MLLERQVAVYRHEDVEVFFSPREKLAILQGGPTDLGNSADFMTRDLTDKPSVKTLVEQYPHVGEATILALAS